MNWESVSYSQENLKQFDTLLQLNNVDLLSLKHSCLQNCIADSLNDLQNSTSHENANNSISVLSSYLHLFYLTDCSDKCDINIHEYSWEETFSRFLQDVPSSPEDVNLLITIIDFLKKLLPLYGAVIKDCWMLKLLKTSSLSIYHLLESEFNSELNIKGLNQKVISLVTDCASMEHSFLDFHDGGYKGVEANWTHLIKIIAEYVKFSDAQHFYNLGE